MFAKRADAPVEASDAFESMVKDDPKHALEVAKRVSKQRKTAPTNRAELERSLRTKFAMELATIISEAGLPVVYQVQQFYDPNKAWKRIFGARRGKTLRNGVRSWCKYRQWLVAYAGILWPRSVADLVNYIEECIHFGCALPIHTELQASRVLLERCGRVPECNQLFMDPTWKAHLQSWSQELSHVVQHHLTLSQFFWRLRCLSWTFRGITVHVSLHGPFWSPYGAACEWMIFNV